MADEAKTWREKYGPWLAWVVMYLASILASYLTGQATAPQPPPPPPQIVEVPVERAVVAEPAPGVDWSPTFGWLEDADVIARNLDPQQTLHFAQTPAGNAALGDEDVFLWRAVRQVNARGPPWYPNINQGPVGCCVGAGYKHCVDVLQASQILSGHRAEWKPVAVEVIYGGSRVEVGGGGLRGDGSNGEWAARWVKDHGVAAMAKYESYDLSEFSPNRAREFGRRGVPDDIEAVADNHPVKSTALVRSWTDVKRAVAQGYPVAVCSDQGFEGMTRDRDGFVAPRGTWPHCMAIIGVRTTGREGGFLLNSWGDRAHTGPVWPDDMPVAGFWADAGTIDGMVREGDSFALSEIEGFPARRPPWFIHVQPRLNPFVRPQAAEVALSW